VVRWGRAMGVGIKRGGWQECGGKMHGAAMHCRGAGLMPTSSRLPLPTAIFACNAHPPGACQPKVADLEVAGGVEQQVGGLEVAVQHRGRVQVLETPQQLRSAVQQAQQEIRSTTGSKELGGIQWGH
jgi:hypothetical protein